MEVFILGWFGYLKFWSNFGLPNDSDHFFFANVHFSINISVSKFRKLHYLIPTSGRLICLIKFNLNSQEAWKVSMHWGTRNLRNFRNNSWWIVTTTTWAVMEDWWKTHFCKYYKAATFYRVVCVSTVKSYVYKSTKFTCTCNVCCQKHRWIQVPKARIHVLTDN